MIGISLTIIGMHKIVLEIITFSYIKILAPSDKKLAIFTVLNALTALNILLILVTRISLLDLTDLALLTTLKTLCRKSEKRESITIAKSNLNMNINGQCYTFQLSSKYFMIPNPIILITHSAM